MIDSNKHNIILQKVLPEFGITEATISALGNGHINDTFLIKNQQTCFVLQKLNTQVFPSPWDLVNNAEKISQHLLQKRQQNQYQLNVVTPYLTQNGSLAVDLKDEGFWRAISYLPESHSVEVVGNADDAELAANAFGHFSWALSDFDATKIIDVIPKFHHLSGRIDALKQAAETDTKNRLSECQQWVDFVLSQQNLFDELAQIESKLPLRICHNDTKINNMLFNKQCMTAMAIIDLDTCMKGHLMYDFGDMVRTCCSPEAEDSTTLDKVIARPDIFEALCRGYLSSLNTILTKEEKQSLWLGAKIMPLMIGVRFLTDYLNGDMYFHTHHQQHNLERAANQFTLYKSLLNQSEQLRKYLCE